MNIEKENVIKNKNEAIRLLNNYLDTCISTDNKHLKKANLIPEYEIIKTCKYELKDKSAVIIVYCSTGSRSKKAQRKLEKMGYKNVYNVYNGIQNFNLDVL